MSDDASFQLLRYILSLAQIGGKVQMFKAYFLYERTRTHENVINDISVFKGLVLCVRRTAVGPKPWSIFWQSKEAPVIKLTVSDICGLVWHAPPHNVIYFSIKRK